MRERTPDTKITKQTCYDEILYKYSFTFSYMSLCQTGNRKRHLRILHNFFA